MATGRRGSNRLPPPVSSAILVLPPLVPSQGSFVVTTFVILIPMGGHCLAPSLELAKEQFHNGIHCSPIPSNTWNDFVLAVKPFMLRLRDLCHDNVKVLRDEVLGTGTIVLFFKRQFLAWPSLPRSTIKTSRLRSTCT